MPIMPLISYILPQFNYKSCPGHIKYWLSSINKLKTNIVLHRLFPVNYIIDFLHQAYSFWMTKDYVQFSFDSFTVPIPSSLFPPEFFQVLTPILGVTLDSRTSSHLLNHYFLEHSFHLLSSTLLFCLSQAFQWQVYLVMTFKI